MTFHALSSDTKLRPAGAIFFSRGAVGARSAWAAIAVVLCVCAISQHLATAAEPDVSTVRGKIIAASTQQPLGEMPVELRKTTGELIQRTAASPTGDFVFEKLAVGDYWVAFASPNAAQGRSAVIHITDRTREIDLGALQYDGQITRLEHVEVSTRKETFVNSIDRKTYRVGTDIRSAGGSVSDLLQSIPSVLVDVEGNVSLRGDSSVLLLVDGKPSTQLSAANRADVLAQMSTDNLDRIEVITNPSAKFKPDGTAGIINLVTKRQDLVGLSGSWRTNLGNDSRGNAGLNLAYNRGPHGFSGNANVRQDDRVRLVRDHRAHWDPASSAWVDTDQSVREHMRPLSRLALLGYEYRPNKTDKLSTSVSYNRRTFFRDSTTVNRSGVQAAPLSSDYDRLRADQEWQKTTEVKAAYSHAFAEEGHELSLDFKQDRHQELENNLYTNTYRLPIRAPSQDATVIKPTESGTEITADYTRPLASGAKLEAGLALDANKNDMDYRGAVLDSVKARWSDDVTRTNRFIYHDLIEAFYATWERSMGAFGVLAGLRLEDSVVNTNQATANLRDRTEYWRLHPTLHLTYQMTESGQLQLNYSHRVHRPETEDLNPFPQYQDPFNLRAGNARLRPEETHSIETGYQYRHDDSTYLATVYLRDTYHAFTTVTRYITPVTLLTTHENLARNRSGGLEIVATTSLGATVTANASMNLFRSEVDASNLGLSAATSATAASAKLNLSWRPTKADTIQLDASHSAKRLTAQGYRLPVSVANLGWRHEMAAKGHAVSFTISDLFNSMEERTVIRTQSLQEEISRRRNSRILYLGYSYAFGKPSKKNKKDDLQFDNSL